MPPRRSQHRYWPHSKVQNIPQSFPQTSDGHFRISAVPHSRDTRAALSLAAMYTEFAFCAHDAMYAATAILVWLMRAICKSANFSPKPDLNPNSNPNANPAKSHRAFCNLRGLKIAHNTLTDFDTKTHTPTSINEKTLGKLRH